MRMAYQNPRQVTPRRFLAPRSQAFGISSRPTPLTCRSRLPDFSVFSSPLRFGAGFSRFSMAP